jgi:hypothetical protein
MGITPKSKYTVKYPDLPSAMRPVPHTEQTLVPKPKEYLALSNNNYDSDKDHGQQEVDNVDCDPTFEASSSHQNPIY